MARHDMTDAATVEMDSDRGQALGTYCLQFLCSRKNRWIEFYNHTPWGCAALTLEINL